MPTILRAQQMTVSSQLSSEQEVARELENLLGSDASAPATGVLHVCSSAASDDGRLRALRVAPGAPRSAADLFMLCVARAQADAVVTTGSILRHEPELTHGLGAEGQARALAAYRHNWLGKRDPAQTVVLSRSGNLPPQHPLWDSPGPLTVYTAQDRLAAVRANLPAAVQLRALPAGGLPGVLEALGARGLRRISLELGPTAVAHIYASHGVHELWCSRFEGPSLDPRFMAGAWPFSLEDLRRWRASEERVVQEPSGPWRFGRYVPAPSA